MMAAENSGLIVRDGFIVARFDFLRREHAVLDCWGRLAPLIIPIFDSYEIASPG